MGNLLRGVRRAAVSLCLIAAAGGMAAASGAGAHREAGIKWNLVQVIPRTPATTSSPAPGTLNKPRPIASTKGIRWS